MLPRGDEDQGMAHSGEEVRVGHFSGQVRKETMRNGTSREFGVVQNMKKCGI